MKNFFKKLFDCKIAMSVLLTGLMSVVLYCIYTPIFGTNDDYIMSTLIQHGDAHSIFMNYFLVAFNVLMQQVFTNINMFIILQIANAMIAFIVLGYVFMSKFRGALGVAITFVFEMCFLYMGIVVCQWTHTAAFLCAAGFALLYYAFMWEERKWAKWIQIVGAVLMVQAGACYRFVVFEVSLLIFGLLCACTLIEKILVAKAKDGSLKTAIGVGIKSILGIVITAVIIVGMAFGVRFLSEKSNASDRYAEFKTFNSARASVNDYKVAPYKGNEEYYNSIGILSQNDIYTIKKYYYDRDFFTTERLKGISKTATDNGYGKLSVKDIANQWLDRIDARMPFHVSKNILMVMVGAAILIAAVLLFIFRNKLKLLFPILLTVGWIIFMYRFTPTRDNFPAFVLALVFPLTSFFYNRYHFLLSAALSAAVFGLYEYQYLSRLSYRVTLTFFLPALVFLLVGLSNDRLRVKYQSIPAAGKKFAYVVIALFSAAAIIFMGYHNYQWKPHTRDIGEPNVTIQNYIKEHDDDLFVYNTNLYSAVDTSRDRALRISDVPDNAVVFADWQISSYYYDELLKDHDIEKLFEEMIDNEHRHFVLRRSNVKSVQQFYNQHYAKDGEKIKVVVETDKEFNKWFCVFRVVTEKAEKK